MRKLLATVALAAMPFAAHAVPISGGSFDSFSTVLSVGGTITYDFEPTESVEVSFVGSGTGSESALGFIEYSFPDGSVLPFSDIQSGTPAAAMLTGVPSYVTANPFTVTIANLPDSTGPAGVTLSFSAVSQPGGGGGPAPIPLPAAGFLLIGGLAALGLASRRRG